MVTSGKESSLSSYCRGTANLGAGEAGGAGGAEGAEGAGGDRVKFG
ncbi:MAG: hypothetical protein F6K31_23655 [Symploca sp. SIO2G7]|nr:hypothetical protein [Symploca sp. SIO2G7]